MGEVEKVCHCVPWYVPSKQLKGRHNICDVYGNHCFHKMMKKLSNQGGWNSCYPLCHQLQFSTTEVIEKREPELLCNQKPTVEQENTNGGLLGTLDYPYPGNRIFEPRFAKQIHDRNDIDIRVPE